MSGKNLRTQVIVESVEARRLLAFTPVGPAVVAQGANVTSVDALSTLSDGTQVVAWTSGGNAFVRLYDDSGVPVSPATQANATPGGVTNVDVGLAADQSFVVTWQAPDTDNSGIYARQFNSAGAAVAAPIVVNTTQTGAQTDPGLAVANNGSFTVVWQSNNGVDDRVFRQQYNSTGAGIGGESLVGPDAPATEPDVATAGGGASVVVWTSDAATLAQRYNAAGVPQGTPITVAPVIASHPAVGVAGDGSFIVAWSQIANGTEHDVLYQRYSATGTVIGTPANSASDANGDQDYPQIDVAGSGKFVIGWTGASVTPGTFDGIGFRPFNASGVALDDSVIITPVGFATPPRFGITYRDGQPVRVAYLSGGAATLQAFDDDTDNTLTFNLNDSGNTLQIYGDGVTLTAKLNGVSTTYFVSDYNSILINGGAGSDYIRLKTVSLDTTVFGAAGNDTITTAEGTDFIEGGLGNDIINAGDGDDYLNGVDENDTLYGGFGNDTLTGGPGRNLMYGEDGDDLLTGGNRADTMFGNSGNDRMRGGAGGDALFGGTGDDSLLGQDGNDGLVGEEGFDTLDGGDGNDTLRGGDDSDSLFGQAGDDLLLGNDGPDTVLGGLGFDISYTDGQDILFSIESRRRLR